MYNGRIFAILSTAEIANQIRDVSKTFQGDFLIEKMFYLSEKFKQYLWERIQ